MGFFDDVTEKTNKIAKESKLKKTITEITAKMEGYYSELGKVVLLNKDDSTKVMNAINEYAEKMEEGKLEIEKTKDEILLLNNKKKCINCSAEIAANASFCPECGQSQEKKQEAVETKVEEEKVAQEEEVENEEPVEAVEEESATDVSNDIAGETAEETVEEAEVVEEVVESIPAEPEIPEGKRKCSGCGEIIDTKYTFCPLCGTKNED